MIILRPYQETILREVKAKLQTHRTVLICCGCGSGKGTLLAYMIHGAVARGKHVIFAVRGRELVADMSRRVSRLGLAHGVLMGGRRREQNHAIQVASIDTLHRMDPLPPADLLILDEARTFMAPSCRKVVDAYPASTRIIGADATPMRLDGKGLGDIFEVMVMGPTEQELIDMGFLVSSIPLGIAEPIDLTGIRKTGGDFNQKQLAVACDKHKLIGNIVQHWLQHAKGLKTIAFGVDQAHARHITDQFIAAGIAWAYVDADTPDTERNRIWDRLDNGDLMGFSNCLIAGVGWDHSVIQCVIAARPTASLALWRQMLGRASRPHPGKKTWVLLDHAGNLARHFPHGFFETPPVWALDGVVSRDTSNNTDTKSALQLATCKVPVRVPESGVPESFTGPISPDGKWMLGSYHNFISGPTSCPFCGLPMLTQHKIRTDEAGQLVSLESQREAARLTPVQRFHLEAELRVNTRKNEYAELVKLAKERNYKPGYAGMQFKTKFGFWPPKGWKAQIEELVS